MSVAGFSDSRPDNERTTTAEYLRKRSAKIHYRITAAENCQGRWTRWDETLGIKSLWLSEDTFQETAPTWFIYCTPVRFAVRKRARDPVRASQSDIHWPPSSSSHHSPPRQSTCRLLFPTYPPCSCKSDQQPSTAYCRRLRIGCTCPKGTGSGSRW